MRLLLDFFRPKKLGFFNSALTATDRKKLEQFGLSAKKDSILGSYKQSEQAKDKSQSALVDSEKSYWANEAESLKNQSDSLVQLVHRSYWGNKGSEIRCDYELSKHYQSFYKDPRFSITTAIFLFIYFLIEWNQSQQNEEQLCNNTAPSSVSFAPLTYCLLSALTIQFIHHLNYQDEAIQLQSNHTFYANKAKEDHLILIQTGNEHLVNQEPDALEGTFSAR